MFTPATPSFATSARLCGSSANVRTEAATTGPTSGHRLQRLERRVQHRVHRPEIARERGRRLLADMPDAQRINQPREIVVLAARDLLGDVAADLAQLARHGALGARCTRRDYEILELGRLEVIQVGKVLHQPLLDQLIDERLSQPFDVHRAPRREVLEAPPQPRRA